MKGYHQKGCRKRSALEARRVLVWKGWAQGLTMQEIAHTVKMRQKGVRPIIEACGGIRPAQRCRSQRVLSAVEREEISRGLLAGCSMREIARHLRRAPSSISREVKSSWRDEVVSGIQCG
jgi:DNA-binding NarL/FixJ family response regulator